MIIAVWKSYCSHVFGTTCPVFGSFTKEGEIMPSAELADVADI
jgi:hypothetical protein